MTWHSNIRHLRMRRLLDSSARRALLLGGGLAMACGPSTDDPPAGSDSSGEPGSTTEVQGSGTGSDTSGLDGTGSEGSSSTGAAGLPCAWVEGQHDAEIPAGTTPSSVTCDPTTNTATISLGNDAFECGDSPPGDFLIIELPPELQAAGEYDLTQLVASVRISADLQPVAGQVDTGTLIITEVTPTMLVGWAHGGREGYDFVGSFEAPYCP